MGHLQVLKKLRARGITLATHAASPVAVLAIIRSGAVVPTVCPVSQEAGCPSDPFTGDFSFFGVHEDNWGAVKPYEAERIRLAFELSSVLGPNSLLCRRSYKLTAEPQRVFERRADSTRALDLVTDWFSVDGILLPGAEILTPAPVGLRALR